MPIFLTQFVAVLIVIAAVDGIWLGLVMRRFYVEQLGPLMREPVLWLPAVAFYLIYAAGLTALAVAPADRAGSWTAAAITGAMVGLVAYATYDLTNLATLKGFPALLAVVDIVWGTVLSSIAAGGGFALARAVHG